MLMCDAVCCVSAQIAVPHCVHWRAVNTHYSITSIDTTEVVKQIMSCTTGLL